MMNSKTNQLYSASALLAERAAFTETAVLPAAVDGYCIGATQTLNKFSTALIVSHNYDDEARGILEFNLDSLPLGCAIARVTLQLHVTECRLACPEEGMTLACYGYAGDGQITAADASAGTLISEAVISNARLTGPVRLEIAPQSLQALIGTGFVGFQLRVSLPSHKSRVNLLVARSSKNINADSTPTLYIEYTLPSLLQTTCVVAGYSGLSLPDKPGQERL